MSPASELYNRMRKSKRFIRWGSQVSLVELWKSSRQDIEKKHVQQVISFAGAGKLLDGSDASQDFREFLSTIPSQLLGRFGTECLEEKFDDRGLAFQDIVNETGSRLGFEVTPGRYRGTTNEIGFDGLWKFPKGNRAIIVEVKTTDAYRIALETIANYRTSVLREGGVHEDSTSILIVVGTKDTEDLEAQIRGSRHAWDIRLIGARALFRLLPLKEDTEDPQLAQNIRDILIPREFTKLDEIIDFVFSTAEDVKGEDTGPEPESVQQSSIPKAHKIAPVTFNDECIERIHEHLGVPLVKRSRSIFSTPNDAAAVVCMVSRPHSHKKRTTFWFGFHPYQKEVLLAFQEAYVAFGCGSPSNVILVPFKDFAPWLETLSTTTGENRFYWHVHIVEKDAKFTLITRKGHEDVKLDEYVL